MNNDHEQYIAEASEEIKRMMIASEKSEYFNSYVLLAKLIAYDRKHNQDERPFSFETS